MTGWGISLAAACVVLLASCGLASAKPLSLDICGASARAAGDGLSSTASAGLAATVGCPSSGYGNGGGLQLRNAVGRVPYNASAGFKVTAPSGIVINSIHVTGAFSLDVGSNHRWWGEFYWNGGPGPAGRSGQVNDNFHNGGCCSENNLNSQSIGWFMACAAFPCAETGNLDVPELQLTADEQRAPTIIATGSDNLWYRTGWVRASWPAGIQASDPSGVCGAFVSFGSIPAPFAGAPQIPNHHTWKQCPDQSVAAMIDTSTSQGSQGLGVGAMQLHLAATNAASVAAEQTKTVYVDNSTPTVTMSGPTDAPSTAGTQYVTATAAAGPSGINEVSCSIDGGSFQYFPGVSTMVPVSGVGQHTVRCLALNNAVDPSGNRGSSSPASWSLKIGRPTVLGVSFNSVVDALHCRRVRERVSTGGRWVTVHRHGRPMWIFVHRRTLVVTIVRCHPQTVARRVTVIETVRRHGRLVKIKRTKLLRVAQLPHLTRNTIKRVPFGHRAILSGWLGSFDGAALPRRTVEILAAVDDGQNHFEPAGSVLTRADGSWRVVLPAGPSRKIEAVYRGDGGTEPTFSIPARLLVPAEVQIQVHPAIVPWGGRIRITGRVLGGHIPTGSNILKLLFGDGPKPHTIGTPEVRSDGRFTIPITWSAGQGVVRYWFAVATLREANYPFTRGTSKRVSVTVGLPTPRRH